MGCQNPYLLDALIKYGPYAFLPSGNPCYLLENIRDSELTNEPIEALMKRK